MALIEPYTVEIAGGRKVVVRTPTEADAAQMLESVNDVRMTSPYTVTQPGEGVQTVEEEREFITKQLDNPNALLVCAEENGVVVGACLFRSNDRRRMVHHGHFGIGVNSTHRGLGIGRVLLTALLDWARCHPTIEKVCLGCFADNVRALKLYRELGFVEEGRRMGEFRDDEGQYFDDVQMMKWVKEPPVAVAEWLAQNGPKNPQV